MRTVYTQQCHVKAIKSWRLYKLEDIIDLSCWWVCTWPWLSHSPEPVWPVASSVLIYSEYPPMRGRETITPTSVPEHFTVKSPLANIFLWWICVNAHFNCKYKLLCILILICVYDKHLWTFILLRLWNILIIDQGAARSKQMKTFTLEWRHTYITWNYIYYIGLYYIINPLLSTLCSFPFPLLSLLQSAQIKWILKNLV